MARKASSESESSGAEEEATQLGRPKVSSASRAMSASECVSVYGANDNVRAMAPVQFSGEKAKYPMYKKTMRAALEYQGLWSVVDPERVRDLSANASEEEEESVGSSVKKSTGSVRNPTRLEKKAYLVLLLSLHGSLEVMEYVDDVREGDAKGLWARLEERYESRTRVGKQQLMKEFWQIKMKSNESASQYISRVRNAANALKAAGEVVSLDGKLVTFLGGLSSAYESIASALMVAEVMSFEKACDAVRNFESMLAAKDSGLSSERMGAEVAMMSVAMKKHAICFGCGEKGHLKVECTEELYCHTCKKEGHMTKTCHRKKEEAVGVVQAFIAHQSSSSRASGEVAY